MMKTEGLNVLQLPLPPPPPQLAQIQDTKHQGHIQSLQGLNAAKNTKQWNQTSTISTAQFWVLVAIILLLSFSLLFLGTDQCFGSSHSHTEAVKSMTKNKKGLYNIVSSKEKPKETTKDHDDVYCSSFLDESSNHCTLPAPLLLPPNMGDIMCPKPCLRPSLSRLDGKSKVETITCHKTGGGPEICVPSSLPKSNHDVIIEKSPKKVSILSEEVCDPDYSYDEEED